MNPIDQIMKIMNENPEAMMAALPRDAFLTLLDKTAAKLGDSGSNKYLSIIVREAAKRLRRVKRIEKHAK